MHTTTFWTLIETAREGSGGEMDKQLALLTEALSKHPEEEIVDFQRLLFEMWFRAYRADLWEAADVIACGCSDSGFHSFRAWLVAQGRTIFEKALEEPQTLAVVVDAQHRRDVLDGRLMSVPDRAYELRTGQETPFVVYGPPPELVGELGEEEERPARFPRLTAKLGDCEEWWEVEIHGKKST